MLFKNRRLAARPERRNEQAILDASWVRIGVVRRGGLKNSLFWPNYNRQCVSLAQIARFLRFHGRRRETILARTVRRCKQDHHSSSAQEDGDACVQSDTKLKPGPSSMQLMASDRVAADNRLTTWPFTISLEFERLTGTRIRSEPAASCGHASQTN